MKRTPTPKQRVLRKFFAAWLFRTFDGYEVIPNRRRGWYFRKVLGRGRTTRQAWASAARNLRGKK